MDNPDISRRTLLQAIAATLATATLPVGWKEVAHALGALHQNSDVDGTAELTFFSAADAADVDAVTAQIVPTDDTPGAREAGVVSFIDRALGSCLAQLAGDYRAQLAAFQIAYRAKHPAAASFAALTPDQQIAFLKGVEQMPFFNTTRLLTLLGMFSLPAYGGNRDGAGWKVLGFEDAHAFVPPFGYYDRDYPGFAPTGTTK